MSPSLDNMFEPRAIAVIGASNNPNTSGYDFLSNLLNAGYKGKIYPIALNSIEVLGLRAYTSLTDVPDQVDYVISCVPSTKIEELIHQCALKHVAYLHLFTGRFAETGDKQATQLEKKIFEKTRRLGIRLIGPNCLGIYCPRTKISFADGFPKESGKIGAFFQSGGNSIELVRYGSQRGLRFSKVVSYGNALDLNEIDFLDYFSNDDETKIIAAYIESPKEPKIFLELLRRTASRKPVVILKGGRGNAGAMASKSHTAALTGSHNIWQVAMKQTGTFQAESIEELIDLLVVLYFLPSIRGIRIGIAGGGGGMAVRTADEWEDNGFIIPPLPQEIVQMIRDRLPSLWWNWIQNPLDVSVLPREERTEGLTPLILHKMAISPAFDLIAANFMTGGTSNVNRQLIQRAQQASNIIEIAGTANKPFVGVINTGMLGAEDLKDEGWASMANLKSRLVASAIPIFRSACEAARAIRKVVEYNLKYDH